MREQVSRSSRRHGSGQRSLINRRGTAAAASVITIVSLAAGAALLFAFPAGAHSSSAQSGNRAQSGDPIYLDSHYTFAERAADLVARLTPTQRASQLVSSQAPTITTAADPLLKDTFGGQTTLAAPANAGDTNIKVESTGGMAVGAKLTIDPDGTPETVTVTSVGSAPSTFFTPTLVVAANPGDTNIKVNFTFGVTAGDVMRIDTGAKRRVRDDPVRRHLGRGRHGGHVHRSLEARARGRRGGAGPRLGNHGHARADERARVPGAGEDVRGHPRLRLVERGAARDQRASR